MQKIVTLVFMLCVASMSHAVVIIPPAPSVAASGYILLDANTGDVIAEQNADMQLAPASLTKIMTMYVIGQELQAGNIQLSDSVMASFRLFSPSAATELINTIFFTPAGIAAFTTFAVPSILTFFNRSLSFESKETNPAEWIIEVIPLNASSKEKISRMSA